MDLRADFTRNAESRWCVGNHSGWAAVVAEIAVRATRIEWHIMLGDDRRRRPIVDFLTSLARSRDAVASLDGPLATDLKCFACFATTGFLGELPNPSLELLQSLEAVLGE